MTSKDAYIEHLENTIKDLQNQVSNLTEMVMLLCKEKFGSSSQKLYRQNANNNDRSGENQFFLFDKVPFYLVLTF